MEVLDFPYSGMFLCRSSRAGNRDRARGNYDYEMLYLMLGGRSERNYELSPGRLKILDLAAVLDLELIITDLQNALPSE